MNITLSQLRQVLQNCGTSLRASDFKDLLDYIEYIHSILGNGIFFGIATPTTNPADTAGYSEGIRGWYVVNSPGIYQHFKRNNSPIVVLPKHLDGNWVVLKYDGNKWEKLTIEVSDLNQSDVVQDFNNSFTDKVPSQAAVKTYLKNFIVQTKGNNPDVVMSQKIVTYYLDLLQSSVNSLTTIINNFIPDATEKIEELKDRVNALEVSYEYLVLQVNYLVEQVNTINGHLLYIINNMIEDAPHDNWLYLRRNGTWVRYALVDEIEGSFESVSFDSSYG